MVLFCYSACIYIYIYIYIYILCGLDNNTLLYKLGPSSFNTKAIDHGSSLRINYGMVTTEALGNYMRTQL